RDARSALSLHDALPICPLVPLSPELVRHINVTTGVTRGSTGLLKSGGKLSWPFVLRQPNFDGDRSAIDKLLRDAISQAASGEVKDRKSTRLNSSHGSIS